MTVQLKISHTTKETCQYFSSSHVERGSQQKIFKRYYRGDQISGGFGIGLSIVKAICDKNGIDIIVNSIPKKGSEFIYKLKSNC